MSVTRKPGLWICLFALLAAFSSLGGGHAAVCEEHYNEFQAKKNYKAMAYSPSSSRCYWRWSGSSRRQVEKLVLKDCRKKTTSCRLVNVAQNVLVRNKKIQSDLKSLGFYQSDIDGKIGPSSRAAIRLFQKINEVKQDAKLTLQLISDIDDVAQKSKSKTILCNWTTTKWSTGVRRWAASRSKLQRFARYNGLSPQTCARILNDKAPPSSSRLLSKLAVATRSSICNQATRKPVRKVRQLESSPLYAPYVSELKRRSMTVEDCARLFGDKTVATPSKKKIAASDARLAKATDSTICNQATRKPGRKLRYLETSPLYTPYVSELRRRGMTVASCALLFGDGVKTVTAKKKLAPPDSRLARATDSTICNQATRKPGRKLRYLETSPIYASYVGELKRRGKTVADCAKIFGDKVSVAGSSAKIIKETDQNISANPLIDPIQLALTDYRAGRYTLALTKLAPLAAADNATAQLHLGHMFALGQGIGVDRDTALEWYKRSKANGNAIAEIMIASLEPPPKPAAKTVEVQPNPQRPSVTAPVQKRLALVMGNGDYENSSKLPNPRNDARAMSKLLRGLGFEVLSGYDLDRVGMENIIRKFARRATEVDLTLFFYAGHGMQVGRRNYLVPIDARLQEVTAVDFELLDVQQTVVKYMGGETKTGIVLLDACRDNPLSRSFARTFKRTRSGVVSNGLAEMQNHGGLLFGFATAPGDVAADGEGKHSPFTRGLIKHLSVPDLELQQVMTRVKREVVRATGNKQRPWHNSDLTVDVYLAQSN